MHSLENRLLLSFSPVISGPVSALGGQPTVFNLSSTGTTLPASWSINWGDGTDPDSNSIVGDQITGNPSTFSHTYANSAATYTVTATAKSTANVTVTAQPLGLDTTFNATGKVVTDFTPTTNGTDGGYATAVDANRKIVVAGVSNAGDLAVARYNEDGSLDTTFGAPVAAGSTTRTGFVTLTLSSSSTEKAYAIALQSDGKIVIAGTTNVNAAATGYDFVVARFTPDGTLDTAATGGFGAVVGSARKGYTTIDFGTTTALSNDQVNAMVIDDLGQIVVAGSSSTHPGSFAVARLDSSGLLDTLNFNHPATGAAAGTRLVTFPSPSSIVTSCQAVVLEKALTSGPQRIVFGGYGYGAQPQNARLPNLRFSPHPPQCRRQHR